MNKLSFLALLLLLLGACGAPSGSGEQSVSISSQVEESSREETLSEDEPSEEEEAESSVDDLESAARAAQALAALAAELPYTGMYENMADFFPLVNDETGKALATRLAWALFLAPPEHSFATPAEAPAAYIVAGAVHHTNVVEWQEEPDEGIVEAYALFKQAGFGYDYMIAHSHVEETARRIFGPGVVVDHQTVNFYTNCQDAGVYGMSGFGLMNTALPVVLGYRDQGDRYLVEAAYMVLLYGEDENGAYAPLLSGSRVGEVDYIPVPPDNGPISPEAEAFIRAQPVHHITLLKGENGGLVYWAHQLPE